MSELNFLMKAKINGLASNFYLMEGKNAGANFDFSASTHPEEYACWNKAIVAFAYINKDNGILKYQTQNKINVEGE
jgi:hypothetical protein